MLCERAPLTTTVQLGGSANNPTVLHTVPVIELLMFGCHMYIYRVSGANAQAAQADTLTI